MGNYLPGLSKGDFGRLMEEDNPCGLEMKAFLLYVRCHIILSDLHVLTALISFPFLALKLRRGAPEGAKRRPCRRRLSR